MNHIFKGSKSKSAKYKKIDRISRKMFYSASVVIVCLSVLLLAIALYNGNNGEILEFGLTVIDIKMTEVTLIILFGNISIFSRYKSRILAYIMM